MTANCAIVINTACGHYNTHYTYCFLLNGTVIQPENNFKQAMDYISAQFHQTHIRKSDLKRELNAL